MAEKISKQKAGRILNNLLRQVALEPTEFCKDITEPGDDRYVTKAEALVRTVYKLALGYKEEVKEDDGTVKTVYHPPNRYLIELIWDRLEGKAAPAEEIKDRRATVSERVSEQGKQRISSAGGVGNGDTG